MSSPPSDHSNSLETPAILTTTKEQNYIDSFLKHYTELLLPLVAPDSEYNIPNEIALFLTGIRDGLKYDCNHNVSLFTVICLWWTKT